MAGHPLTLAWWIQHAETSHQVDLPIGRKVNFTSAKRRSLQKDNTDKTRPLALVASDKAQNCTRAIHTTFFPEHSLPLACFSWLVSPATLVTDMGSFTSDLHHFHFLFLTHQHILSWQSGKRKFLEEAGELKIVLLESPAWCLICEWPCLAVT